MKKNNKIAEILGIMFGLITHNTTIFFIGIFASYWYFLSHGGDQWPGWKQLLMAFGIGALWGPLSMLISLALFWGVAFIGIKIEDSKKKH